MPMAATATAAMTDTVIFLAFGQALKESMILIKTPLNIEKRDESAFLFMITDYIKDSVTHKWSKSTIFLLDNLPANSYKARSVVTKGLANSTSYEFHHHHLQ